MNQLNMGVMISAGRACATILRFFVVGDEWLMRVQAAGYPPPGRGAARRDQLSFVARAELV